MTDAELLKFASQFRRGILGRGSSAGMCAAVCWPLAPLLSLSGVAAEIRQTDKVAVPGGSTNHVWIELADGRALDPTADQFNTRARKLPPVYLGPKVPALHRAVASECLS